MSDTTTSDVFSSDDADDTAVSALVEQVQQLTERVADLEQELANKNDRIDDLKARITDLEQNHDTDVGTRLGKLEARDARLDHVDVDTRIDSLREELETERERRQELEDRIENRPTIEWQGKESQVEDLWVDNYPIGKVVKRHGDRLNDHQSRINDLEDEVEDMNPGVCGAETTFHDTVLEETPLEQICGLTDDEAREHLWSNQQRARKLAMAIPKIATDAPKGYTIDNNTLRSELTRIMGKHPNDNDVKRVRDFLSDLGKDHVDIVDHRGSKMLVVDKGYAKQLGRKYFAPEECLVVEHKNNWRDLLHLSSNPPAKASTAT
ncbi:hypothetical protein [Halomicrococcus sp. NG-SE-24]|uniref:hypothetical protein n=1 Tax=Halomicrococcus sp. NG-SE-24 TaxID=3436928 RepID=UPI003D975000